MRWLRGMLYKVHRDHKGLEGLEYLLIAALVIIATVAAWKLLGSTIREQVDKTSAGVKTTTDDAMATGFK
jgi:Flp pilus assembly pilin Flp